jgi:hypothetical protein
MIIFHLKNIYIITYNILILPNAKTVNGLSSLSTIGTLYRMQNIAIIALSRQLLERS